MTEVLKSERIFALRLSFIGLQKAHTICRYHRSADRFIQRADSGDEPDCACGDNLRMLDLKVMSF